MEKVVTQKSSFDLAQKLNSWHIRLSYITAIISFATGIIQEFCKGDQLYQKIVSTWLPGTVLILAVTTILLQLLFAHQYQKSESIRRDSFFDNAFGTLLADKQSKGYFSNDIIPLGLNKALFNIGESCFYSLSNVQKMFDQRIKIAIPIGIVLIAVIVFNLGGHHFTMLALNLFLSLNIVEDLVRLFRLKLSLEKVLTNCKAILSNYAMIDRSQEYIQVTGQIIREIVRYETALSYASTMLDSKYYKKINSEKEKEWEEFKKRYDPK